MNNLQSQTISHHPECAWVGHADTHPSITTVPVRKKGITSILLTSFANISAQHNGPVPPTATIASGMMTKDGGSIPFFPDSVGGSGGGGGPSASGKTRKNDFYIGNVA